MATPNTLRKPAANTASHSSGRTSAETSRPVCCENLNSSRITMARMACSAWPTPVRAGMSFAGTPFASKSVPGTLFAGTPFASTPFAGMPFAGTAGIAGMAACAGGCVVSG